MHPSSKEIVPNHDAGNHLATTVGAEMKRRGCALSFVYRRLLRTPRTPGKDKKISQLTVVFSMML